LNAFLGSKKSLPKFPQMQQIPFTGEAMAQNRYDNLASMLDARLDLSRSPITIPGSFYQVRYDHERYPGAPGVRGLVGGANCQQYAYEFLRAFGFTIPDFRSSDLWADTTHSVVSQQPQLFDLVLVHDKPDPWGAHVGVYLATSLILHLSQKIGVPAIERLEALTQRPQYRYLIGFKRILMRQGISP
jgi:murein DD-endopeptidase / murein LD-carboxypeptidase